MKKIFILFIFIPYYIFSETINLDRFKSGDIIFRKENSFLSDIFSKIDSFDYSHVGLVIKNNSNIFIYHMENEEDKSQDLKIEPISIFLENYQKYSTIRLKAPIDKEKLNFILNSYKNDKNLKFDLSFKLNNGDSNLYCSEFVNEIYKKLIGKNIYSYLYNILGEEGITIKSIYLNKNLFDIVEKK
ncbi:YiiX/YebB-like N1pC/P60 family cysteine hydrolase [Halarcobacter sp.]|uniref:YiiX/YebB-like N1pC/P60 family cysteine hydrolase n=1 Tax=Halarcobacter sp. TaxID=2321133 RepID=UPI0029F575AF|nr:YiiX/YebB-like N1pC/P60 family cysteine hydrolase [Halarcobacter sp.]